MSKRDDDILSARKAFVQVVKNEQKDEEPWVRDSLRQHWAGATHGFGDEMVQRRWKSFLEGWIERGKST